jgi:hypothetical protein
MSIGVCPRERKASIIDEIMMSINIAANLIFMSPSPKVKSKVLLFERLLEWF